MSGWRFGARARTIGALESHPISTRSLFLLRMRSTGTHRSHHPTSPPKKSSWSFGRSGARALFSLRQIRPWPGSTVGFVPGWRGICALSPPCSAFPIRPVCRNLNPHSLSESGCLVTHSFFSCQAAVRFSAIVWRGWTRLNPWPWGNWNQRDGRLPPTRGRCFNHRQAYLSQGWGRTFSRGGASNCFRDFAALPALPARANARPRCACGRIRLWLLPPKSLSRARSPTSGSGLTSSRRPHRRE